ncbi:uncharacterized protein LOC122757843 [Drosophila mojavensis]|uniref:uncharacterized protein LOC122757843 n=1 Tax=Drosophila mojavensis TaxID=7230 RepID=UPI001CD1563A|nr:uncharacterized protein LOC122757843 [Drosophila mojavensis]
MILEEGLENHEFDLLDTYLGATISPTDDCTDVYTKIETLKLPYMKANVNVLNFWRERKSTHPELYALSKVCFAIPPTQVTIERAFSSLKLVLADNRNRLNHDTLENILLVKLNSYHLDGAIDSFPSFEDEENNQN